MVKKILKRKQQEEVEKEDEPKKIMSDEPAAKKVNEYNLHLYCYVFNLIIILYVFGFK